MKTLIVSISTHHGNTQKIAQAIAGALDAEIVQPQNVRPESLDGYDLIGFGSGIYNGKHHKALIEMIEKLPLQAGKKAFVFSTNTFGLKKLHEPLKKLLAEKGYGVIREFSCPGFIDFGLTKYFFGGLSKNRPNGDDLNNAGEFARRLI